MSNDGTAYRGRLYARYLSNRSEAPDTLDGLQPRAPYLRKLIRDHFPPDRDAAIVDLGCGHGALIHFARQAGYHNLEGMDGSHEQVVAAKRLGIDGVREGDLRESLAAMPDASRDAVVAFDVIEHFRKDELLSFVDEVRRVLRPGGRWIIHSANGESPLFGRIRYGDFTHEMAFTRESISQLLLSSDFQRVECFEDAPVPHGVKSSVRWFLWKGIRGGLRLWLAVETGDSGRNAIFSQNLLAVATK